MCIFVILLYVLVKVRLCCSQSDVTECDTCNESNVLLGDVPLSRYPWLGVLYYSKPSSEHGDGIVVTTVVLIQTDVVIAPAAHIGPIPTQDFRKSRVLLGEGWERVGRRVRSCIVHPEYSKTRNTLALVRLRDTTQDNNIIPLNLPVISLIKNPKLYVVKFREDFKNLQKRVIFALHLPDNVCKEMDVNADSSKTLPRHAICAVAEGETSCVWKAGAALVFRDRKRRWQLLGLGVRDRGCAAPSRYLDIIHYTPWLKTSLNKLRNMTKSIKDDLKQEKSGAFSTNNETLVNQQNGEEYDNCARDISSTNVSHQERGLKASVAYMDTVEIYPTLRFKAKWVRKKNFWNKRLENRYQNLRNDTNRPRLKVIVVPHSHNDPGWLNTFEGYFRTKTKFIISNIVQKLHQYSNMTFVWAEISFLDAWWKISSPAEHKALKKLIQQGRLEITSGGWVMPDEACTHIYGLLDQFIEGHNWVKRNLGVSPITGWSIDPFGHGPTVPYLLDKSGLHGTIIQRIHYAWKHWFAQRQIQDFHWIPGWASKKPSLVVHHQPFDLYSIRDSCGPHPFICLRFDFRKIPGEHTDYSSQHEEITDENLISKSKTLIEEYGRIGSLTRHNVVLVPLGDDFRYEKKMEFDLQYVNYMKMFNYINDHKDLFNANVQFGTPNDYFNAFKERQIHSPTLKGDFFVYSDIFNEGIPAYWSGFYTTRPYFKILVRQLEHQLRTSEILFTIVLNYIRQNFNNSSHVARKLEKSYEQLIISRRNLGLFQHHDAITGTSREKVMHDYGIKLFASTYHCISLQETALAAIMIPDENLLNKVILQSETEWESYEKPVRKIQVSYMGKTRVVLFNSLAEERTEVIKLRSNTTKIRVYDNRQQKYVLYQIAPNIKARPDGKRVISETSFDIMFVATLPALTAVSFNLERHVNKSHHCEVFCNSCKQPLYSGSDVLFDVKSIMPGDIHLDNQYLSLVINGRTGFLKQIFRKHVKKRNFVEIQFDAYLSARHQSGAYLFRPNLTSDEESVLHSYSSTQDDKIIIISGPVLTEVTTMYPPLLVHSLKIYNVDDTALSRGVFIESTVNFEDSPKNSETELFMRIQTDIQNGDIPEYYTDQNGFQFQKRVKVEKLGIEANYYPITTMAWLQDDSTRLTLVTNHAQGSAAFEPGRLEVMLDRRTLYDDFRGIGEGVVDNKPTAFHHWLLLEPVATNRKQSRYELPSATAAYLSRALNYPVNTYLIDASEAGGEVAVRPVQSFVSGFPAGVHLLTLRTITDDALEQFPSANSYLVLQRPGLSCGVGERPSPAASFARARFAGLRVSNVTAVSLTGLRDLRALAGLQDVALRPMDVRTYRITF